MCDDQSKNYFHVISRGINKQIIFEEDKDYQRYLKYLKKYSISYNVDIVAYCLMTNHIHILVYAETQQISMMMKCVNQCYVNGYNIKYNRSGSLMQNRPKKLLVSNPKYLVTVFYYILNNPYRSSICETDKYP